MFYDITKLAALMYRGPLGAIGAFLVSLQGKLCALFHNINILHFSVFYLFGLMEKLLRSAWIFFHLLYVCFQILADFLFDSLDLK